MLRTRITGTGIKERRIAAEGEYTSTFALQVTPSALEMASVSPEDLNLTLLATVTPDFPFPATACILQHDPGTKNAFVFDLTAAKRFLQVIWYCWMLLVVALPMALHY
jgi:3-oxoacyl-[acyl-carrier-protein] synthase-3